MRRLHFIMTLVCSLSLIGCSNYNHQKRAKQIEENYRFSSSNDSICFIQYNNRINGFNVKIEVCPFVYTEASHFKNPTISGVAQIQFFVDDTCQLSFHNPYFSLNDENIKNIKNGDILNLDYIFPKIDYSKPLCFQQFCNLPFFFIDVNFDGAPELLLNYSEQGQRWHNAYVAYELQCMQYEGQQLYYYDFLYDAVRGIAPYQNLDNLSEIDFNKQEISTFCYGGMDISTKEIYRKTNGKMNLAIIEEYDSLGYVLARRQILTTDTITSYHNNREYLYKSR